MSIRLSLPPRIRTGDQYLDALNAGHQRVRLTVGDAGEVERSTTPRFDLGMHTAISGFLGGSSVAIATQATHPALTFGAAVVAAVVPAVRAHVFHTVDVGQTPEGVDPVFRSQAKELDQLKSAAESARSALKIRTKALEAAQGQPEEPHAELDVLEARACVESTEEKLRQLQTAMDARRAEVREARAMGIANRVRNGDPE